MNPVRNLSRTGKAKAASREVISNGVKSFRDRVRDIVRKIPQGKTMTYKEVAAKAGNTNAARAVGAIMRSNYDEAIPCHRVVRSDGALGEYNRGGTLRKQEILRREGALS